MSKMLWFNIKKRINMSYFSTDLGHNGIPAPIYAEKEFHRVLERERERANRNNHQFSLIVFDFELPVIDQAKTRIFLKKIIRRLRIIDEIGWYGAKRIGIILPYTSKKGARQLTESLSDIIDSSIQISTCTICTYPERCDADKNKQKSNQ